VFDAQLARQVETWKKYWETVTDSGDAERQLRRLRWLEEFAFHCGPEITPQHFLALEGQIERGERRLAELRGDWPQSAQRSKNPSAPEVASA